MRHAVLLAAMTLIPGMVFGQDSPSTAHKDTTSVWLSVALGPASGGGGGNLVGAQVALWGARNRWALVIRRSGGSNLDTRDLYDTGVLLGARTSPDYFTFAAAAGPVIVTDYHSCCGSTNELGAGFSIEAAANVRYVGIGVVAYGAAASRKRFAGIGLVLQVGKIQ